MASRHARARTSLLLLLLIAGCGGDPTAPASGSLAVSDSVTLQLS
jgi:hypothetical protein